MGLYKKELPPPVWFMRQAGRYHSHYQERRAKYSFMQMCKDPDLAAEITMGPISDFDFDAAILFSDLLFPLEQIGLGLSYEKGPPSLERYLESTETFNTLEINRDEHFYNFQKEAVKKLRTLLPSGKSLIGFTGSPFTLFTYATQGEHKGALVSAKTGLYDGRFEKFLEIIIPIIKKQLCEQIEGGADTIALFDTAAGELCFSDFSKFLVPAIRQCAGEVKAVHPEIKIIYYAKMAHLNYLKELVARTAGLIDIVGVDWRIDIIEALKELPTVMIQGNIDPVWLHLPPKVFETNLLEYLMRLKEHKELIKGRYIFGLGHGVLPKTPEINVKRAIKLLRSFSW